MIIYLTFNDAPSGIFSSQVIDVVKFLRRNQNVAIKLVSFMSLRGFTKNRKRIRAGMPDAVVLPMFPGLRQWRLNSISLEIICFFLKPKVIMGRSVLATQLAFGQKRKGTKIIYDGRGAIAAEWKEYQVVRDRILLDEIESLERLSVLNSDFCLSVSMQLILHWQKNFGYQKENYVIIPCTLNATFEDVDISPQSISISRAILGFGTDDLVIIYAGSSAGWQSLQMMTDFLHPFFSKSANNKMLFLGKKDENISKIEREFPNQVVTKSILPDEVAKYMIAGDYGMLVREQSVTNKVASPVKFAEYLACGLKVIISENLGDYTVFVSENNCGGSPRNIDTLVNVDLKEKLRNRSLAIKYFTKGNLAAQYNDLIGHVL